MNFPTGYEKIFQRLDDHGLRESESGQWSARCPSHEDRTPSLSLRVGDTGCLLIKCMRNNGNGCHLGDILAALDCTTDDIFPPKPEGERKVWRKQDQKWDYRDEHAKMIYQVVRYTGEDGSKRFLQRRPNPDRSAPDPWLLNLNGIKRVLFRLPEILAHIRQEKKASRAPTVVLVEGERCVGILSSLRIEATTNSGGAGKFSLTDYSPLADCHCVVIPDNDVRDEKIFREQKKETWTGQSHAEEICRLLYPITRSVKYVDLPGVPVKADIAEWVEHRLSIGMSHEAIRKELLSVIETAPVWVPPAQPHPFFAACENESKRLTPSSRKEWANEVEKAAGLLFDSTNPVRTKELVVLLGGLLLAGAETYLGMVRPKRSLPVQESSDGQTKEPEQPHRRCV